MVLRPWIVVCLVCCVCLGVFLPPAFGAEELTAPQELVEKARISFESMTRDPNFAWIQENWSEVQAVFIVPQFLKGAFVFGGAGGSGVLCVRSPGTDTWSSPAFYTLGSASIGLQIGGSVSEVVLMVMSRKGVRAFYSSSFKLGAELSLAAGPVGGSLQGATAQNLSADMITFSRVKGAFAGLSLEGGVIKARTSLNRDYYGQAVLPYEILAEQAVSNSQAEALRRSLAEAESP